MFRSKKYEMAKELAEKAKFNINHLELALKLVSKLKKGRIDQREQLDYLFRITLQIKNNNSQMTIIDPHHDKIMKLEIVPVSVKGVECILDIKNG